MRKPSELQDLELDSRQTVCGAAPSSPVGERRRYSDNASSAAKPDDEEEASHKSSTLQKRFTSHALSSPRPRPPKHAASMGPISRPNDREEDSHNSSSKKRFSSHALSSPRPRPPKHAASMGPRSGFNDGEEDSPNTPSLKKRPLPPKHAATMGPSSGFNDGEEDSMNSASLRKRPLATPRRRRPSNRAESMEPRVSADRNEPSRKRSVASNSSRGKKKLSNLAAMPEATDGVSRVPVPVAKTRFMYSIARECYRRGSEESEGESDTCGVSTPNGESETFGVSTPKGESDTFEVSTPKDGARRPSGLQRLRMSAKAVSTASSRVLVSERCIEQWQTSASQHRAAGRTEEKWDKLVTFSSAPTIKHSRAPSIKHSTSLSRHGILDKRAREHISRLAITAFPEHDQEDTADMLSLFSQSVIQLQEMNERLEQLKKRSLESAEMLASLQASMQVSDHSARNSLEAMLEGLHRLAEVLKETAPETASHAEKCQETLDDLQNTLGEIAKSKRLKKGFGVTPNKNKLSPDDQNFVSDVGNLLCSMAWETPGETSDTGANRPRASSSPRSQRNDRRTGMPWHSMRRAFLVASALGAHSRERKSAERGDESPHSPRKPGSAGEHSDVVNGGMANVAGCGLTDCDSRSIANELTIANVDETNPAQDARWKAVLSTLRVIKVFKQNSLRSDQFQDSAQAANLKADRVRPGAGWQQLLADSNVTENKEPSYSLDGMSETLTRRQFALDSLASTNRGTLEATLANRNAVMQRFLGVEISEHLLFPVSAYGNMQEPKLPDGPPSVKPRPFGRQLPVRRTWREEWTMEDEERFCRRDSPTSSSDNTKRGGNSCITRSPCLSVEPPHSTARTNAISVASSVERGSPAPGSRPRSRGVRSPLPGGDSRPQSSLSNPIWRRCIVSVPSPSPVRVSSVLGAWNTFLANAPL